MCFFIYRNFFECDRNIFRKKFDDQKRWTRVLKFRIFVFFQKKNFWLENIQNFIKTKHNVLTFWQGDW